MSHITDIMLYGTNMKYICKLWGGGSIMAFVMDITGLGTLAESAIGAYDRWNAYRKESKDANIEVDYYKKAIPLEMNKNLQILNRIKDNFDYKDIRLIKKGEIKWH
jgi:hypothetical protein